MVTVDIASHTVEDHVDGGVIAPHVSVMVKHAWTLSHMADLCTYAIGDDWDGAAPTLSVQDFVTEALPDRRKVVSLCVSISVGTGDTFAGDTLADNGWLSLRGWVVAHLQTLWPEFA